LHARAQKAAIEAKQASDSNRVQENIGAGAMGVVYKGSARECSAHRLAIKMPTSDRVNEARPHSVVRGEGLQINL